MKIYLRSPSAIPGAAATCTRVMVAPTLATLSLGLSLPGQAVAQCIGTLTATCAAGTYTTPINIPGSPGDTIDLTLQSGVVVNIPAGAGSVNAVNIANTTGASPTGAPATLTANDAIIDNTSNPGTTDNTGLRVQSSGNATITASGRIDVLGTRSNDSILAISLGNAAAPSDVTVVYGSPGAPGAGLSASGTESVGIQADNRGRGNARIELSGNVTGVVGRGNASFYGLMVHSGDTEGIRPPGTGDATAFFHAGTIDVSGNRPRGIVAWAEGDGSATVTTDPGTTIIVSGTDPGDSSPTLAVKAAISIQLDSATAESGRAATATVASRIMSFGPSTPDPSMFNDPVGIRALTYANAPVTVTYTGPGITTQGGGAAGIQALSASGNVTVNATGPIDTTNGSNAVGILADSGSVLSRNSGILADAIRVPVSVARASTTGAVEVNATNVTSMGEFGTGISAAAGNGGVKVTIAQGGSVMGGWQADLASVGTIYGLPATGVYLNATGGGTATLTNNGSIGALSDRAIAGDPLIINNGTVTGFVQFTDGDNGFTNNGVFNLRHFADTNGDGVRDTVRVAIADFGPGTGNTFTNNGTLVLAPAAGATTLDNAQQYLPLANPNHAMALGGPLQGQLTGLATFTNSGTIDLQGNAVAGDVLVITGATTAGAIGRSTYLSSGGILKVDAVLNEGGPASRSDMLVVDGTQVGAGGSTKVQVRNVGGAGALTPGNGVGVVEVLDKSRSAAGAFALAGRVVAGPYEYLLFQGGTQTPADGNWYLRSQQADPVTPIPPLPPNPDVIPPVPTPPPLPRPLFRPEVGAYLSNERQAGGMFVHSLHDRLGEPQWIETQSFDTQDDKRRSGWLRIVGKNGSSTSRDGTFDVDTDSTLIQGGGDLASWGVGGDRGRLHLGGMLGYGSADSDATAAGNLARAKGKVEGWSVGLYGTWYQNNDNKLGWYADVWGTYGWFDNKVQGDTLPEVKYDAKAYTLSGETGYAMRIASTDWVVEPQGQLLYIHYSEDDITEFNGTRINGGEGSGWISRLGVRTYRTFVNDAGRRIQPYLTLNWWHDNVDNSLAFNQVALKDVYPDDRYEVKLGLNADIGKGWTAWGVLGYQWGNQNFSNTTARLGAKYTW